MVAEIRGTLFRDWKNNCSSLERREYFDWEKNEEDGIKWKLTLERTFLGRQMGCVRIGRFENFQTGKAQWIFLVVMTRKTWLGVWGTAEN